MKLRMAGWVVAIVLASIPQALAQPQNYPARTINFVVPNLAGGSSDLIARAIGAYLQKSFGQPVVIDNKPGASEMIATELLARAAPDGYTIAILSNALAINQTLSSERRYDGTKDVLPVARLAVLPFALIVRSSVPASSLKEFVEYAKNQKGKLSYGHVGVGAPHFLTMEWFKREAGLDILAVPFRSSPPVYAALLGGDIQVTMGALGGAVQFINNGQVRALAAMSSKRPISQPNLPTVSEFGYPTFDLVPWMGVFVPAGTPDAIVKRLEAELLKASSDAEVRQQLQRIGLEPSPAGTADFKPLVGRDIANWAKVIKDVNAKP